MPCERKRVSDALAFGLLPLNYPVSPPIPNHQPLRECIACVQDTLQCVVGGLHRLHYHTH
jgi:hypothetical protein